MSFKFGLSPNEPELTDQSDLWSAPLPMTRHAFEGRSHEGAYLGTITYGDYFTAARDFLNQTSCHWLRQAAGRMTDRIVEPSDIQQVAVYLLKHGAFYHPARVVLSLFDQHLTLVLNVAVSPDGRRVLPREHACLERLNKELATAFWPEVFGFGRGCTGREMRLPMFVGQWFDGYHEFHLTSKTPADQLAVAVWDTDNGPHMLSGPPVLDLMRRAAAILTYAYNPLTFEAILDWHHAAGDFVVQVRGDQIDLRLITVRNYAPLVSRPEPDVAAVLDGLLLLLVSVSLRLRMDRLDGVGAPAVFPDAVIPAICEGFWQGLKMSLASRGLPEDFIPATEAYCSAHTAQQLSAMVDIVLDNFSAVSEAGMLLRAQADEHAAILAACIKSQTRA